VANQMIALQTKGAQLPDPAKATAQYANMMNMAAQQRASQLQGERTRQEMDFAKNAEARAVAGEGRAADKFSVEQSQALVSALGTGIVKILRDPSDASIGQVGQTFTNVGLKQTQFGPLLKQIQDIPDANARKLFVMDLVAQSPEATATLKAVMPDLKETKVGNTTVFYDGNPNSVNFGKPIFNITAPAEPTKMTQNVVDGTLMNTNPYTGVSAEAITGDPTQNLAPALGAPTFSSTGVTSPYAVGAGTGQQPMMPPATPAAPPAAAVGVQPSMGAPGAGGDTFSKMIRQESRGNQFNRSGKPLTSSAGAIGIAQVMPKTAPEAAKLAGLPFDDNRYRNDREYNLALGKAYYEKQLRDFGGDERLAAAAYNAGPGAVRSALKKGGPNGWINHVPSETRKYVRAVFGGGGAPTRPSAGTPTRPSAGTPTAKPQTVGEMQRKKGFQKTLELFNYDAKTGEDSVTPLIKASTSGGAEKIGADIVGFIPESMGGGATPGAIAIGQLESLKDNMTFEKLRGKLGAQISDADVRLIASTMGDIANAATPAPVRLAKWQNIVLPILVRGAGMTPVKRATPTGGGGGKSGLPRVTTDAQWNALKPGQEYIAPNGEHKRKR
jgi:hypothetical protein